METYAEFDASVVRAQFFLNEFGNSLPTEQIADFARQLSLSTGASQGAIAGLEGYLARFRASGADIERATQVIVNASQATGVGVERLGRLIERARQGHARGLWTELGIQVKGFEGQLYSLNQIIDIVDNHTRGFSEQFGQTLPGELRKTAAAVEDMVIQFGRLFAPAMLVGLRVLQGIVHDLAETFRLLADALGIATPGMEGAGRAAGAAGSGINRTDQYLQQIAFNTGPQGPLAHAMTGGGSFAEPGGGLHIRDFNLQFRAVR